MAAAVGILVAAVEAVAARGGEGEDDFVAVLEVLKRGTEFVDVAGKFVAHNEAGISGLVTAEDVKFTVVVVSILSIVLGVML